MTKQGLLGKIVKDERGQDVHTINIWFSIGNDTEKEGNIFIELKPAMVEKLRAHFQTYRKLGYVSIAHLIKERKLGILYFYPFGHGEEVGAPPRGTKIGTQAHHAIAEYLALHYPGHTIQVSSTNTSPEREKQLIKMGFKLRAEYPIEQYRDITRTHMAR
ncbi:MAG: hypothetical protein V1644_00465 [Candidatus Micrarchaeota archaeon]